jgi:hypothetical protein
VPRAMPCVVSLPRWSLVTVRARLPAAHHVEERSFDDDVPGVDNALEGDGPRLPGNVASAAGAAPPTCAATTAVSGAPRPGLRSAIRPFIESPSLGRSDACTAPRRTSGAGTGITEFAATLGALQHPGKDVSAIGAEAVRISYRLRLGPYTSPPGGESASIRAEPRNHPPRRRARFTELGVGEAEASDRAWLAYAFYIGHHQLGRPGRRKPPADHLDRLVELLGSRAGK